MPIDLNTSKIVLVEFRANSPYRMIVCDSNNQYSEYWIEWCKRDECLYIDCCSCGTDNISICEPHQEYGAVKYWLRSGHKAKNPKFGTAIKKLPKKWSLERIAKSPESETIFCNVCEDWLPIEALCQHLRPAENEDCFIDFVGCGNPNQDLIKEVKQSFFYDVMEAIDREKIQSLREALLEHEYRIDFTITGKNTIQFQARLRGDVTEKLLEAELFDSSIETMSMGCHWLLSLESKQTNDADLLTVEWINEWLK